MKTETQILRKAVMKKNKTSDLGEKFKKGSEVFIQEKFLGKGRFRYVASNTPGKLITGVAVLRSEFEYTDKEEYVVFVTRTVQACKEIIVKATDREEAKRQALEEAGNYDFGSGDHPEYETGGLPLTIAEHKDLYPNSNLLK
jgi:hypothetical protein